MTRWLIGLLLFSPHIAFATSVSIPWNEFKLLYDAKIQAEHTTKQAPYYSISATEYTLNIQKQTTTGTLKLEGKWIQGQPEPIPLATDMTISQVSNIKNGSIVKHHQTIAFLPDSAAPFSLEVNFAFAIMQDETSYYIELDPILGIHNRLTLIADQSLTILEKPGIPINQTTTFLSTPGKQQIRFSQKHSQQLIGRFSTLTQLRVDNGQLIARVWLAPKKIASHQIAKLDLPEHYHFIDASIDRQFFSTENNTVTIQAPNNTFWVDYLIAEKTSEKMRYSPITLHQQANQGALITLKSNTEGFMSSNATNITNANILNAWHKQLPQMNSAFITDKNTPMTIHYMPYIALKKPSAVLDSALYNAEIQANGKILSRIHLALPSHLTSQYLFTPPEGATIWSINVNRQKAAIYSLTNGQWAIPLDQSKPSVIDIAYLEKIEPLRLSGRLPLTVPQLNIAAKKLNIKITLPKNAEISQIEGNILSDSTSTGHTNTNQYHFLQPLYEGAAVNIALHYQEPTE